MKTPREIYAAYTIMPSLQLHQLRVAAVAKLICDNFQKPVNAHDVILACLFHDMGNILKFELTMFPEFTEPEGAGYWESVKEEYRNKYGDDEHSATQAIVAEIGLSESVQSLMRGIGFSKVDTVAAGNSLEQKIIQYSDMRVGPRGVLSLAERLEDGRQRYLGSGRSIGAPDIGRYNRLVEAIEKIEEEVFSESTIKPEDIHDTAVAPLIELLGEYEVS